MPSQTPGTLTGQSTVNHWPVKSLQQQSVYSSQNSSSPCQITPATVYFSQNSSSLACQITLATVCLFLPKQFIISMSNHSNNSQSIPHKTVHHFAAIASLFLIKQFVTVKTNYQSTNSQSIPPRTVHHCELKGVHD